MSNSNNGWGPRTRFSRMVQNGDVTSVDQTPETGLPLKELQLIDQFPPGLDDEMLDINMIQCMTDSGRRAKFRCVVAVGDRDGCSGYAEARGDQVGGVIQKAIEVVKLDAIKVDRGSGSREDRTGGLDSLSRKVEGKAGSVTVRIIPASQGLGLAAAETVRNILELAGVQDAWTKSSGNTRVTVNLAKAVYNALKSAPQSCTPWRAHKVRREVRE